MREAGLPRAVARRRGHDRHARQEGPDGRQDHRGVPAAARRGHLPDADDDAPRLAAALSRAGSTTGCSTRSRLLRKAGAVSLQVLMITPVGGHEALRRDLHERAWPSTGSVGGRDVEPHMYDGNYVVASRARATVAKQLNLLLGYLYFYNPLRFLLGARPADGSAARGCCDPAMQVIGMLGLLQTVRRTSVVGAPPPPRAHRARRRAARQPAPDASPRHGDAACHALPGTAARPRVAKSPCSRAPPLPSLVGRTIARTRVGSPGALPSPELLERARTVRARGRRHSRR